MFLPVELCIPPSFVELNIFAETREPRFILRCHCVPNTPFAQRARSTAEKTKRFAVAGFAGRLLPAQCAAAKRILVEPVCPSIREALLLCGSLRSPREALSDLRVA